MEKDKEETMVVSTLKGLFSFTGSTDTKVYCKGSHYRVVDKDTLNNKAKRPSFILLLEDGRYLVSEPSQKTGMLTVLKRFFRKHLNKGMKTK